MCLTLIPISSYSIISHHIHMPNRLTCRTWCSVTDLHHVIAKAGLAQECGGKIWKFLSTKLGVSQCFKNKTSVDCDGLCLSQLFMTFHDQISSSELLKLLNFHSVLRSRKVQWANESATEVRICSKKADLKHGRTPPNCWAWILIKQFPSEIHGAEGSHFFDYFFSVWSHHSQFAEGSTTKNERDNTTGPPRISANQSWSQWAASQPARQQRFWSTWKIRNCWSIFDHICGLETVSWRWK